MSGLAPAFVGGGANTFTFSEAELSTGCISQSKLAAIEAEFLATGLVLLVDVIPKHKLAALVPRVEEDLLRQLIDPDGKVTWKDDMGTPGHYGTYCPKHLPWLTPEVHANRVVETVVEQLLGGPGFFMISAGGNAALPGSGTQWIHTDGSHRWKTRAESLAAGAGWPHRCQFVVANFGVQDITPELGGTEVWPGSHADMSVVSNTSSEDPRLGTEHIERFFAARVAARRTHSPPVAMNCPVGSVVLRDNRVWHRGVQNVGIVPRHMVGLAYIAREAWRKPAEEMVFGPGCEALLAHSRCQKRPFVAFAEDDDSLPLIEGHGDWVREQLVATLHLLMHAIRACLRSLHAFDFRLRIAAPTRVMHCRLCVAGPRAADPGAN
jgi:hypothetical protein